MLRQWGAILTGFVVSAAYWPGMLSAVFVPRWAAIAVLVPLLWRLDFSALPGRVLALLAILFGAASLSLLATPDAYTGIYELILLLVLAVSFVGGAGLETVDDVMIGLAAGLGVSSAVVLAQINGWQGVVNLSGTPSGLFFNSEILAEFAALVLVWGMVRRNPWIVAATLLPLVASHSRVAMLSVGVALLYAWRPRSHWLTAGIIAGLAVLAVLLLWTMGLHKMESAWHRIMLWLVTATSINPLGNGIGWFQSTFPTERFAHSDLLQGFAEIGIAAGLLLFIPYWIFRGDRSHVAERAVFVAVCVQAAISFPLHFPATGFTAAVVTGFLLGAGRAVRLGFDQRGTDHGRGLQRQILSNRFSAGTVRCGGVALSVRSLFARGGAGRAHEDFKDSNPRRTSCTAMN